MSVFLKATWQNLIQLIYTVPADAFREILPAELEPELIDGKAILMLSAMEFRQTRVKGLKIPFHVNFPEINLRVRVLHNGVPGVFFLRQFVPKHCIAVVARRIYNEPYESFPLEFTTRVLPGTDEDSTLQELSCKLWRKDKTLEIRIYADDEQENLSTETDAEREQEVFETLNAEILNGFGLNDKGSLITYTIEQKALELMPVREWSVTGDVQSIFEDCLPFSLPEIPDEVWFSKGQSVRITQPR